MLFFYLIAWPVPIDPVKWSPPPAPNLIEEYTINNYLSSVEIIHSKISIGPEDVAVDEKGNIYGGFSDGKIIRFSSEGNILDIFADTKGRPLGLDFDKSGNLIIADAKKGLLSINENGIINILANKINNRPLNFTDDVDVSPEGMIYFTDASTKFNIHNYRADFFEHRPYGRLIKYDPFTKELQLLLDSLYFANGVAVNNDGSFLLFSETYDFSISKYWLKGPNSGKREKIFVNVPGFPDGISSGSNGIFWIGIFSPRNLLADAIASKPFIRKIVYRLPLFLQPTPARHGFILGIDSSGNVLYNLQDSSHNSFSPITSVEEVNNMLYLGSLSYPGLARISRPQ